MKVEEEIRKIQARNRKVELDKAWETSWTRRLCIMFLTYLVVILYSLSITQFSNIWFTSLVPVIGFTLSTLSLNLLRGIWEKRNKSRFLKKGDE